MSLGMVTKEQLNRMRYEKELMIADKVQQKI